VSRTVTIDYRAGRKWHQFLLCSGTTRTILLGRDFLIPTDIGVFVGRGGWTVGTELQKLIPFVNSPSVSNKKPAIRQPNRGLSFNPNPKLTDLSVNSKAADEDTLSCLYHRLKYYQRSGYQIRRKNVQTRKCLCIQEIQRASPYQRLSRLRNWIT
jgi:hypothetical protein